MNKKRFARRFAPLQNLGFTLVEMIVVVAIFGVVGSLIFVQISSTKARSRDAQREQAMKTLQNALALYANNLAHYPITASNVTLNSTDVISTKLKNENALPQGVKDPLNADSFQYVYKATNGTTYEIQYYLETNTILGKSAGEQSVKP